MFSSDDSLAGSIHNDVLNAEPETSESRDKLVDEIKNRAKACIGTRNYPTAVKLYSKAIEVLEKSLAVDTDNSSSLSVSLAVLHANRSMCYLNVGNASAALEDAVSAENLDPTYVKVYYRKAAALKGLSRFSEAKNALLKGLELKTDDKEMKALLTKIETDLATQTTKTATNGVPAARKTVTTSTSTVSKPNSSSKEQVSSKDAKIADDDDDLKDAGTIRGYKKTADGRVTTFFNHELDETTKSLIGDIAPKKLDAGGSTNVNVVESTADGSSVWNTAGTYEEKILTPWATEQLRAKFSSIAANLVGGVLPSSVATAQLRVTSVEKVTGDAQISIIRGKRKHICDYTVDLKWELNYSTINGSKKNATIVGNAQILDITADKEFELGAIEVTTSGLDQTGSQLVSTFIKGKSSPQCLEKFVITALGQFCDEFKSK